MSKRVEFYLPDDAERGACRSCGAAIAWIETDAGKAMPLSIATVREENGMRYAQSHFADCPNANRHRKAKS